MVSFPFCKINLGLHVVAARSDGYHDIETCFFPLPWHDVLEILPAASLSFTGTGRTIPGNEEDNICLKAWRLLRTRHSIAPVSIHLHKVIPIGAGLGGGSSDGAFALNALNSIFSLNIGHDEMKEYAALLGSDCAFFLAKNPAIGTGKGEVLEPLKLDLKGRYIVVLNPGIHVSTSDAYASIKPKKADVSLHHILSAPVQEWRQFLVNDFEATVFRKYPAIAETKARLYEMGALYASMSGSGASVFGIFENKPAGLNSSDPMQFCAQVV